jgi:S-(hydroxymethyl)glutathione dehydrogenase/alcohol dehydrogenase
MSTMMQAAVLGAPGERLVIEEIPVPRPRAHEVLVRTSACGVCHTDLHVIKGEVPFPSPAVLGHEISGVVAKLGSGVGHVGVGDRVVSAFIMPCGTCRHCARGRDDLCHPFFALNRLRGVLYDGETRLGRQDGTPLWMYSMGGLAQYCVVPAADVFPLPDGLDERTSAILGCATFTAYGAVRHAGDVRPGDRVAVIALGGVGSNIVALAAAFGARQVIAIDVDDSKLEPARALGATHTVNARDGDLPERVRELTDGEGVDVAFEALGRPQTFEQALAILADGGRMVPVGIAAGQATAAVPITRLVRRSQRIVGSYGARTRTDMPAVLDLAARGVVDPAAMVSRTLPLEDANAAFEALDAGQIVGRAVIVFGAGDEDGDRPPR